MDIISGTFTELRMGTKLQIILEFLVTKHLLLLDLEFFIVGFDELEMRVETQLLGEIAKWLMLDVRHVLREVGVYIKSKLGADVGQGLDHNIKRSQALYNLLA